MLEGFCHYDGRLTMSPEPRHITLVHSCRLQALRLIAVLIALGTLAAPVAAHADSDAGRARTERPLVRLSRSDAWFGVATIVGAGAVAFADHELRERALATDSDGARHLASAAQPFGAPEVVGSALLLGYLAGRALDRPALASASARVGIPVAVAAVTTMGFKLAIGRVRPEDSAAESDPYQPLSGHASFPSGHAALAFATATALDRETDARWVPWVAYPIAALVGWSRVRDDKHWTSDTVAGAALGAWTAAKTHDALRKRAGRAGRLGVRLDGGNGTIRSAVRLSF